MPSLRVNYYKRNKIVSFAEKYNKLKIIMLSEINHSERTPHTPPHTHVELGGRYKSKIVETGEGRGA